MAALSAVPAVEEAAPSAPTASTSVVMDGQLPEEPSSSTAPEAATTEEAAVPNGGVDGEVEAPEEEKVPAGPPAVETLYINNLNEKVSLKIMKETLKNLFKSYGVVLDVVMHRNLRMRGQAFIAMANRQAAARAVEEVRGFPLYGKPLNVSFARTPSDAVVKRKTPDLLDVHLEERKKRKSRSSVFNGSMSCKSVLMLGSTRRNGKSTEPVTKEGCCRERSSEAR